MSSATSGDNKVSEGKKGKRALKFPCCRSEHGMLDGESDLLNLSKYVCNRVRKCFVQETEKLQGGLVNGRNCAWKCKELGAATHTHTQHAIQRTRTRTHAHIRNTTHTKRRRSPMGLWPPAGNANPNPSKYDCISAQRVPQISSDFTAKGFLLFRVFPIGGNFCLRNPRTGTAREEEKQWKKGLRKAKKNSQKR
jgi:hypothetical protein